MKKGRDSVNQHITLREYCPGAQYLSHRNHGNHRKILLTQIAQMTQILYLVAALKMKAKIKGHTDVLKR
jgi:hypothetical protein